MATDLPIPTFMDITPEVQAAAQASTNRSTVLTVPENAVKSTTKKNETYYRWNEPVTIDSAWSEQTDGGLTVRVLQLRVRAGSLNGGARVWARHMLHPAVIKGDAAEEIKAKYGFMTDAAINALSTLLLATGLQPETGGITGKLQAFLFPVKDPITKTVSGNSPLKGKTVIANFVDAPNTGEKATTPRQTKVESYLPDSGE